MKLKKEYGLSDGNQIFRIMISDTDKLIIETRDIAKNQAYFHCYHVNSGKSIFTKKQFDETYWIGIEEIYNDIIYLHKFAKPDMPGHKGIYAFDIDTKKIIWQNDDYSFLFILNDLVYAYVQKFEGRRFVTLNSKTGDLVEELGENIVNIQELKNEAQARKDFSQYQFPNFFNPELISDNSVAGIITSVIENIEIIGSIEYTIANEILIFNYHFRNGNHSISNEMKIFNIESGDEIYSITLNKNVNAYAPDSFFVYKNLLLVLKEKNELLVYNLD